MWVVVTHKLFNKLGDGWLVVFPTVDEMGCRMIPHFILKKLHKKFGYIKQFYYLCIVKQLKHEQ